MATATAKPSGTIDFGRSFTFVIEDPDWIKKILIGGVFTLLSVILVGIPFVLGYVARTLRNVVEGAPRPLPEWDDLGGLFSEGLRLFAVYLVYMVGGMLVAAIPGCLMILPMIIAAGSNRGGGAAAALGAVGMLGFYAVMMLLSLALFVYMPAAITRVALRGAVADGFAVRSIVDFIRRNLGNYLLALVAYIVAGFVAQFGVFLCCLGLFPALLWSYLVLAASLGQTVRLNPGSLA